MLFKAVQYVDALPAPVEDALVEEEALQIGLNRLPYTMTMRTPGNDECLTAGLLFTEHVIGRESDILSYEERPCEPEGHNSYADVVIPESLARRQNLGNRTILSSSSCGLCGKTDVSGMNFPQQPLDHNLRLDVLWLETMQQLVSDRQALFQATGGCHAAAAFSIGGDLLTLMEDVGRHNAVDKVIGYLLINGLLDRADLISVSGRVSYEIVAKLHTARIPFLVSVSAPSTLAVELCDKMGMTLISFCRGNKTTVYSHDESVIGAARCAG
ncbi:MAG: formate dehydrogenase accessory sulfurtransferase FdhD [Aeoliella sp.]